MDYVQILKDLISLDTTVPPGRNYDRALDYLEPLFQNTGCVTERVPIPEEFSPGLKGRVFLLAHRRAASRPRLIFYTHVDVVPAEGWDGFTPVIAGGKMYGRGTADMKGSIAGLLLALERIKGKNLKYDTSVMVTTDEEIGHQSGKEIIPLRPYLEPVNGAYFFSLDCYAGAVMVASLGGLNLEITIRGKSAHGGTPYLGENAIEKALIVANALMELKAKVATRRSSIAIPPEAGVTQMVPNLSLNIIKGGVKSNIIPDECVITVARRLIPEENIETVEKEIRDTLESVKGVRWEAKVVSRLPTVPTADKEPAVAELAGIIKEVTGKTGKIGLMGGQPCVSLDWKAKVFGTGVAGPGNNVHGINEFVALKDIEDLAKIIERFLRA
jgi:succinyl-diaminopimelate desuccinylase